MTIDDRSLRVEPLAPHHERGAFACGNETLDRYLQTQAGQDLRSGVTRVFVAVAVDQPHRIAGFFTLNATSISRDDLPEQIAKRLPRYPIPAALIGRLAIDRHYARQGLGQALLAEAVRRIVVAAGTVAMTVVIVDPIDDAAQAFYGSFGFRSLSGPLRRMFLMLPVGTLTQR